MPVPDLGELQLWFSDIENQIVSNTDAITINTDQIKSLMSRVSVLETGAIPPPPPPIEPPPSDDLLTPSGSIISSSDGQVIENKFVTGTINITHDNVTVRNCRIHHTGVFGIDARDCTGLNLETLDIVCQGTNGSPNARNINIERSNGAHVYNVRARGGSSNIYCLNSRDVVIQIVELHDAKGPYPRGQNVQFNQCPGALLEDFSAENNSSSFTEDNISVYNSSQCTIRRGLVYYNNSPSGVGVMFENSSGCLAEDVDAVQQGNGAFSAWSSSNITFRRCRTRDSYNGPRDGREPPQSNSLSIAATLSSGGVKHNIIDCSWWNLANPSNLIWQTSAVNAGYVFVKREFTPRNPIRLIFPWD